jgi:hypothetical protein
MMAFIKGMPFVMFYFILACAFGLAVGAVIAGRSSRRRAALIQAMPTSNIGMVADGYCELEGRIEAVAGPPLLSPLTRQPVAWYHATVERYVGKRKNSAGDGWTTLKDATSGAPFLLRDATGACAVHPYGADITATDKSLWYGATAIPTDRNPVKLGPKDPTAGGLTIAGTANTQFRYFEERIYVGDPVLVLGNFTRGRSGDADDEEDDEDDEDEFDGTEAGDDEEPDATDADEAALDEACNDDALVDDLSRRITAVTPSWVSGGGGNPFIISTRLQAVDITEAEMGGQAMMSIALLPLAIGLLLLYARFG